MARKFNFIINERVKDMLGDDKDSFCLFMVKMTENIDKNDGKIHEMKIEARVKNDCEQTPCVCAFPTDAIDDGSVQEAFGENSNDWMYATGLHCKCFVRINNGYLIKRFSPDCLGYHSSSSVESLFKAGQNKPRKKEIVEEEDRVRYRERRRK